MSRVALAVWAALALPAFAQEAAYFRHVEDVPIASGLFEQGQGFVFDHAGGRMVVALALGAGEAEAVADFYLEALPQLGWAYSPAGAETGGRTRTLEFQRGRERLVLALTQTGSDLRLDARLTVASAPAD